MSVKETNVQRKKSTKIIVLSNSKGGVGKTTTALTLGAGLYNNGYKVLLVDLDPQMNLSYTLGVDPEESMITVYDLFCGKHCVFDAIIHTEQGMDLIPGSLELAGADMEFTKTGREYILRDLIKPIRNKFDYIIIDTPPALGILTVNALTAATNLIIPIGADVYSMQGLGQLTNTVSSVKKYCNPNLKVDGLLLTKYSNRAIINRKLKEAFDDTALKLGTKLFRSTIREAVAIKEVQFLRQNLFESCPKANITLDYKSFINEYLEGEA